MDDKDIPYTMGMIFRNRTGNRIQFVISRDIIAEIIRGSAKLFEELMQRLNHTDQEAVRMTYGYMKSVHWLNRFWKIIWKFYMEMPIRQMQFVMQT